MLNYKENTMIILLHMALYISVKRHISETSDNQQTSAFINMCLLQ